MKQQTTLALILLLIFTSTAYTSEVKQSIISGQVVDMDGNPIPNFSFMIASVDESLPITQILVIPIFQNIPGFDKVMPDRPKKITTVQSDADGHFNDISIPPGSIQLVAIPRQHSAAVEKAKKMEPPDFNADQPPPEWGHLMMTAIMPDKRIVAVQTTGFTLFLPHNIKGDPWDEGTLRFTLPPGVLENLKIKVQPQFELQIRIVSPNGTPIVNAEVDFSIDLESANGGIFGTEVFTDADGYFTYTTSQYGIYTITANYQGQSGSLSPFRLDEKNDVPKNLVIRMGGKPVRKQLKPQDEAKEAAILIKEAPIKEGLIREALPQQELADGVWIVNPENGHAYKKITCSGWHDAQRKAIEQDAHLVSINDQAEQIWVSVIFGEDNPLFWIGLNDVEEEGKWQWDSGEPVTFTYWSNSQSIQIPSTITNTQKDYAVMGRHHGGWEATASLAPNGIGAVVLDVVAEAIEAEAPLEDNIIMWSIIQYAVIEKDGLVSKIPQTKPE